MTDSMTIPVRHLWQVEGDHYSSDPSHGAEFVFGPHSTMQVIAVPAGAIGLLHRTGRHLTRLVDSGGWSGTEAASPEVREALKWAMQNTPSLMIYQKPMFLLRREEECDLCDGGHTDVRNPLTGGERLRIYCGPCNGTGTVVTHRLERGEVMEKPNLHLLLNPQTTAYFMDAGKFSALIFTPTLQSWESGEVGDWFQVERRLLG